MNNAFNTDPLSRANQDVGLDGIGDAKEAVKFGPSFLDLVNGAGFSLDILEKCELASGRIAGDAVMKITEVVVYVTVYFLSALVLVATSDVLEQETAGACGAECISPEARRWLLEEASSR